MATAYPIEAGNKDNYELELNRVREKIKTKFVELIDCLKARESELLRELDNILASYLSYKSEFEKVNEIKRDLGRTKSIHQNELADSLIKSVHEDFIARVNTELKSIKTPKEPATFTFKCDCNKMLAEFNKLGKLVEKVGSGIDYKSKKRPLVSVCKKGKGKEQLNNPEGVAVDNITGNIYVADQSNHCVKVFDSTGKYLFKFGDNDDKGKMNYPIGVAICGDRILITQDNNYILNYRLNGKFISRIRIHGRGEIYRHFFIIHEARNLDYFETEFILLLSFIDTEKYIIFYFSLTFILYRDLIKLFVTSNIMHISYLVIEMAILTFSY